MSWDLRLEVLIPLLTLGALQFWGWRALRRRGLRRFANGWRLAAYLSGLLVLAVAVMSPIDVLGGQLFMMHMVQHLLLVMVAPPLLLLANPFPTFLWVLPREQRKQVGAWFAPQGWAARLLRHAAHPAVAWFLYLSIFLGWHDANLYNLALRVDWVHDLEHLTFFGSALLFWWHVIGAGPHVHRRMSPVLRAVYALSMVPPNMFTGVAIAFAQNPIYTYYATLPRLYGISVMDDQVWGGQIMWIPGSMMYIVAAVILIGRLLGDESEPMRSMDEWSTDEALVAPGLEERARRNRAARILSQGGRS